MRDQRHTATTDATEVLVERYHHWLTAERGLAAGTLKYYVPAARPRSAVSQWW